MMASDSITIRLLRKNAADLEALAQLERRCAQGTGVRFCYTSHPPRFEKYVESIVLLAEDRESGLIVGAVCGSIRTALFKAPDRFEKFGLVHTLRVLPEWRRFNVASKLVEKLEKIFFEQGVSISYGGTSSDNVPSQRFFMGKFGYKYVFTSPYNAVNIGHVKQILAKKSLNFVFEKIPAPESEKFIREKWGDKFMFPAEGYPVKCTIYSVSNSSSKLTAVVANVSTVWIMLSVPWSIWLKQLALRLLNWFMPRYFEKPLPYNQDWRFRHVCPYLSENINSKAQLELFFNALVGEMVRDLHGQCDILMIHAEPKISGLDHDFTDVVRNSDLVSKTMFRIIGHFQMVKSLAKDPKVAEKMEQQAIDSQFWFLDGKEI